MLYSFCFSETHRQRRSKFIRVFGKETRFYLLLKKHFFLFIIMKQIFKERWWSSLTFVCFHQSLTKLPLNGIEIHAAPYYATSSPYHTQYTPHCPLPIGEMMKCQCATLVNMLLVFLPQAWISFLYLSPII